MDRHAHHRVAGDRAGDRPTAVQRAGARWGLDRVLLVHGPQAEDDRDLARALQRRLRHLPVVMLDDRLLPGALLLEHMAVGPGGVTVVAGAAELIEPLQVECLRGMFGAHAVLLRDGTAADRTALVAPVRERVAVIRRLIDDYAPVLGALCLTGEGGPERLRALEVEGVLVAGPKAVAELAAREGDLRDYELASMVDLLDRVCPPVLG
ncbi:MAG TPA: hypothetical protein VK501_00080 [Baekduia sp.]|uniref:hypothetical protein n=1 Tax=Baekduia sp. TaxID=2600305 RepID=UPI002BC1FC27|nr:hypothetical protein [Baekduia sp.]HMJ32282.1 hypothetical protein [Baekduia sp.]